MYRRIYTEGEGGAGGGCVCSAKGSMIKDIQMETVKDTVKQVIGKMASLHS